jgi:ABC-2 type transport system permease protein
VRVGLSFYTLEIKKILAYRVEFWIGFFGTILSQFGVAYFLWQAIFSSRAVTSLQGFGFGSLMLYYFLVPLIERSVNGQEAGYISGEIYDGGLSRFLIYPIDYFRIKFIGHFAQTSVFLVQLFLALSVLMAVFRTTFTFSLLSLAQTIPVIVLASFLHFAISINLEMLAFWADNVWSISILNRMITNLLGGGMLPLVFFPQQMQTVLEYLPFSQMVSFPIRCLLGQLDSAEWLKGLVVIAIWSGVFVTTAAWTWRKGLRNYSGVGI